MHQPYKLRLGDGTVLAVDHDGLSTWLVDDRAMVQRARSKQWQPLKDFLAEERVLARYAARKKANARDDLPPPLPSPREQAAARSVGPPPSDSVENAPVSEPPSPQVSADEPAVFGAESSAPQSTPDEEIALLPEQPSDAALPVRLADSAPSNPIQPSWVGAPPSLLVLADDPATPPAEPTRRKPTPYDELPIISLKPLDDEPPAQAASGPRPDEGEQGTLFAETPQRGSLDDLLHWLATTAEALLAWWSDGLARLVRRLAAMSPGEPTQRHAAGSARSAAPDAPCVSKPLTVQVLADDPMGSSRGVDEPLPRERLSPPPALSELPVLRLAETDEPEDAGDVYEGESQSRAAWLWTKRIVVTTGLVAGGIFAATTQETWFPKAIELGPMIFTEIDKQTGARDPMKQQQRALEEASESLPHLAPETIRRLLSRSPSGVLDPAEVFRLANEAAARGVSALSPSEAQELDALWRKLLGGLTPGERERVREYDSTRRRRATYPFEDRAVVELFAGGARALQSQSRARLQALSGKAVAAGLVLSAQPASRATAKH